MKRYTYGIILLFAGALSLHAQDRDTFSEQRDIGSFDAIDVGQAITVSLEKGDKTHLQLEVKNGSLSDVETEVVSGKLHISLRSQKGLNSYNNMQVRVHLTYVELKSIDIQSVASVFSSSPIVTPGMNIEVSSAGSLNIPLKVKELLVKVSSAGKAILTGSAGVLNATVSTAGKIDASNLKSTEVNVKASTGANVDVFVKNTLIAHASSGSVIHYLGDPPHTQVKSSSGGSVTK